MLTFENKLEAQKILHLVELGHSIDGREWPERRDLQQEYLRQKFGWSFDCAFDFAHADNDYELQQATWIRAIEASQKGYNPGASKVFQRVKNENYQDRIKREKKEFEDRCDSLINGVIQEVFDEAKRTQVVNSQKETPETFDEWFDKEWLRLKAEQALQPAKKNWKSGDGFGRLPKPGIRGND